MSTKYKFKDQGNFILQASLLQIGLTFLSGTNTKILCRPAGNIAGKIMLMMPAYHRRIFWC
jgi:hypothetical protein